MADEEARPVRPQGEQVIPNRVSLKIPLTNSPLSYREALIHNGLRRLGITVQHTASLGELRELRRAREAVGVLYDAFGDDLSDFLTRPLIDYGGKSVVDLVAEHGVRALEAVRSDVEYPVPA